MLEGERNRLLAVSGLLACADRLSLPALRTVARYLHTEVGVFVGVAVFNRKTAFFTQFWAR